MYKVGEYCCVVGFLIPIVNLILRIFNYDLLLRLTPGGTVSQNPLSSILFIGMGIIIWILRKPDHKNKYSALAKTSSLAISTIGLIKILTIITGNDFVLDHLLFQSQLYIQVEIGDYYQWNSMAANTAFCFLLLGICIYFIDEPRHGIKVIIQYINFLVILIALLSIYGYIYQVKSLYGVFRSIPMSFHSACCLLLFATSILILRPDQGSMAVLVGENPAEIFFLRLTALLFPLIFGWFKIEGRKFGLYDEQFGTAMFAIVSFAMSMIFIGMKSKIQHDLRKAKSKMYSIIKDDNERMKRILDNSPSFINIYDKDEDRLVYSNFRGSRSLHYSENTTQIMFGDFVDRYVHPDDRMKVKERAKSFNPDKDEETNVIMYRLLDAHNKFHWVLSKAIVYKRKEGVVKQILFNGMDITEIKRAQEQLSERNAFIEKVAETTPDILHIYDLEEEKNVYANRNVYSNLGYSKEDLQEYKSLVVPSIVHPDDYQKLVNYYKAFKTAKENEVREIEYRLKNKKGDYLWMSNRETVFSRDSKRQVKQVIGVVQDVTRKKMFEQELRKKNEALHLAFTKLELSEKSLREANLHLEERVNIRTKELQKSEERYKAYIENSFDGIWSYDFGELKGVDISLPADEQAMLILKHARIAECNDKMAEMYGYGSSKDLIGKKLDLLLKTNYEVKLQWLGQLVKSKYNLVNVESEELNRQGQRVFFLSNIFGIIEKGVLTRVWRTQTDITNLKRTSLELERQNERIKKLAFTNAHKVRADVARILGLLTLINSYANKEEKELYIQKIKTTADSLDVITWEIAEELAEELELV